LAAASQCSRFGRRRFTPLMLNVAICSGQLLQRDATQRARPDKAAGEV